MTLTAEIPTRGIIKLLERLIEIVEKHIKMHGEYVEANGAILTTLAEGLQDAEMEIHRLRKRVGEIEHQLEGSG